jgi:uncharacterized protein
MALRHDPSGAVPVRPTDSGTAVLRPLGLAAVSIESGLWASRQAANHTAIVEVGYERVHAAGNLDDLALAASGTVAPEAYRGPLFMDSDVYKWLEAAAWELARRPSDELRKRLDEVVELVAAAQQGDGYLNSYVQVTRGGAERYRDLAFGHELYCYGHLFQAAVAARRAVGEQRLWQVALAAADHVVAVFRDAGNDKIPGHPLIEMALVELGRESGNRAYLDLARRFVERRGHQQLAAAGREPIYFSDRVPVRDATTVEGHAVRAMYLAAGVADVVLEGADEPDGGYRAALDRQWRHMVATKTYLTGGLGSRWDGEAFGDPFELPPDVSYCETCAAIGSVQWSWRMLLATGEPRYADLIERTLLNGMLSGVSLDGDAFFYVNPLQVRSDAVPDDHRQPVNGRSGWYHVACCPPNVMRTVASVAGYLATADEHGVQLHQFAAGTIHAAEGVSLQVRTDYPWDETVTVEVAAAPDAEWELALRIPSWCDGATVTTDDGTSPAAPGYWRGSRRWRAGDRIVLQLPMPVRLTAAHPRVDAVRGCVAVERGPLVYCVEQVDQPAGAAVDDVAVTGLRSERWERDLLGGVRVVELDGVVLRADRALYEPAGSAASAGSNEPVVLTAVPYFAWANRGVGPMRVWLPDERGAAAG